MVRVDCILWVVNLCSIRVVCVHIPSWKSYLTIPTLDRRSYIINGSIGRLLHEKAGCLGVWKTSCQVGEFTLLLSCAAKIKGTSGKLGLLRCEGGRIEKDDFVLQDQRTCRALRCGIGW